MVVGTLNKNVTVMFLHTHAHKHTQLGFVKINLAEYAGAGTTQRKYLLESYNENKHKPDNSILKVRIALRQTSGDVLFKA